MLFLQRSPPCFGGLALIVSFCASRLPCSSSSDFALCAESFIDECWCSAYQSRKVFRIEYLTAFTTRASMVFSSYADSKVSNLVYNFWAISAKAINPYLRFRLFASSLAVLLSVAKRLRVNWDIAEYNFNARSRQKLAAFVSVIGPFTAASARSSRKCLNSHVAAPFMDSAFTPCLLKILKKTDYRHRIFPGKVFSFSYTTIFWPILYDSWVS